MVRLTTLALVVILIFIQLSSIECMTNSKKKKKGCAFNGDILRSKAKRTYSDLCVELVCLKVKRKGKDRKKGGGGKGNKKLKYVFEAKAIEGCSPTNCMDMPCGNGRCMPPEPGAGGGDKCEDPSSACPAEWQCTVEKYTDPDTGCTKCRCNSEDPQYEEFCRPVASICPLDCGVIKFVDENTGCMDCKCDPGDIDNPFVPPVPKPTISAESSRDWPSQDGCNTCTCMNGIAACTEMACIDDDSSICKTGCSKEMVLVCGSDGVTYDNTCMLDFARICNGTNVKVGHAGSCDSAMKCEPCSKRKWEPVCGNDCKTYPNECMLDYENCENGKYVKQVMRGSCEDGGNNGNMKCIPCNKRKWDPVCGDDGKTYSNACMLDFANCENGSDVKQVKKGECEGDKKRKVKRPKREIRRSKEKKRKLLGKDKNKEKKGKCMYNGKRVKKVKDLDIYCTQLKCTKDKETRSSKLEMQYKSDCKC